MTGLALRGLTGSPAGSACGRQTVKKSVAVFNMKETAAPGKLFPLDTQP